MSLPWWLSRSRIGLQCWRSGFDSWVGKIPWRRERLPIPVFWLREFHELYSPWSRKELDTTEWLSLTFKFLYGRGQVCLIHCWTTSIYRILVNIASNEGKQKWAGDADCSTATVRANNQGFLGLRTGEIGKWGSDVVGHSGPCLGRILGREQVLTRQMWKREHSRQQERGRQQSKVQGLLCHGKYFDI